MKEKAALVRGSFIHVGQVPLYQFLLPVTQVQIFPHFSAFVTVFQRFLGLMIQFAEWVFWIPNGFRDDFHHSFHNTTLVVELCRASPSLSARIHCPHS
jgi:hypothetical protein